MIVWLLLSCSSPASSELRAQRQALDAWEEGRRALEAEQPGLARDAFARALEAQPDDPLLLAWRAAAEADAGDLQAALGSLDRALERQPDFAEARYRRATYLAQAGRPAEAGPDLRRALELGAATPQEARRDPAFRPFLDHDAFDFLPASSLLVVVEPLPDRAFRGSEVPVKAVVRNLEDADALAVEGIVHGPVGMRRSLEDRVRSDAGTTVQLRWDLVLTGTGDVTVGPLSFRVAGEQQTSESVTVKAVGPDAPGEPSRWRLATATQLGGTLPLDRPTRRGERVFVRTEPTSQVTTRPEGAVLTRHERRTGGQPDWLVWELGPVEHVVVRGTGGERYAGPPMDPEPRR